MQLNNGHNYKRDNDVHMLVQPAVTLLRVFFLYTVQVVSLVVLPLSGSDRKAFVFVIGTIPHIILRYAPLVTLLTNALVSP